MNADHEAAECYVCNRLHGIFGSSMRTASIGGSWWERLLEYVSRLRGDLSSAEANRIVARGFASNNVSRHCSYHFDLSQR